MRICGLAGRGRHDVTVLPSKRASTPGFYCFIRVTALFGSILFFCRAEIIYYAAHADALERRSAKLASSRLSSNSRYSGTVSSTSVIASPGKNAATAPQASTA
jgi:hypothetical protein